jgi:uncharacterized protein (DUF2267 family)
MANENTNVQEIEFDNLEDLLGVGSESIMVPNSSTTVDENKKPGIFSQTTTDTTFLDKPITNDPPVAATGEAITPTEIPSLEDLNLLIEESFVDDPQKNPGGRPSLTKDVMIETANKLIEKGLMFPFDDGKKLEDYSQADWEELLEANFNEKEDRLMEEVPASFYQSLPQELQKAYEYVANGGTDLKNMFRALASAEEVKELDVNSQEGQEDIIRAYLQVTKYGTREEIEEEIIALKDRGDLELKAGRFKPRLDQMQEQVIQQRIQQQEETKRKQDHQAQLYQDNVYKALERGELNGMKLDNKVQNMLFSGLVQPNYPSINGRQTNMLGHLLEKYQWVEPRHDLIAEALWLLADPDGYKSKLKESGERAAVEKTVRQLKTEEATKISSSTPDDSDDKSSRQSSSRTLQRPKKSFFGR